MEYANRSERPTDDAIDAKFKITPPPLSFINGMQTFEQLNTPLILISYSLSKSSSAQASIFPTWAIPAVLFLEKKKVY
jgi:hypothetical protein